jgi:acetyl-CoA decarbonylase/synthase complex subunit beta
MYTHEIENLEKQTESKLPQGRIYRLKTKLENLWDDVEDIGIGPRWMKEIRKREMHLELGGPKWDYKSYQITEIVDDPSKVEDGKLTLIGPEVCEVPTGVSFPFACEVEIYGKELNILHREYCERQIVLGWSGVEGLMTMGPPFNIWQRFAISVKDKLTIKKLGQIIYAMVKTNVPFAEAIEIKYIIGTPENGGIELIKELRKVADAKLDYVLVRTEMKDEDVDIFYGCTLCKILAPNHVCIITPETIPYCGILSYAGAKVTHEIDPSGYTFAVEKKKVLNPLEGSFEGVNEAIYEKTGHVVKEVRLYTSMKYPTTNCGCFEATSFYIPEVDGIGLVNRRYSGIIVNGLKFSGIAGMISGGTQFHGFKGLSVRGMRSKKFLQGDGGWNRIVWIPKDLKLELANAIPEEVYDKIATEEDVLDVVELEKFLKDKGHPVVEKYWKNGKPQSVEVPPPGADWEG